MKMVPTEVTEMSTLSIHTPGNYPKEENTRYFRCIRKIAKSYYEVCHGCLFIHLSLHVQQLSSHQTDLDEI
jgi:hypothetical protein